MRENIFIYKTINRSNYRYSTQARKYIFSIAKEHQTQIDHFKYNPFHDQKDQIESKTTATITSKHAVEFNRISRYLHLWPKHPCRVSNNKISSDREKQIHEIPQIRKHSSSNPSRRFEKGERRLSRTFGSYYPGRPDTCHRRRRQRQWERWRRRRAPWTESAARTSPAGNHPAADRPATRASPSRSPSPASSLSPPPSSSRREEPPRSASQTADNLNWENPHGLRIGFQAFSLTELRARRLI